MSPYLAFRYHQLSVDSYSFSWSLTCLFEGTVSLVQLIGVPESRGESKDTQESFPALGERVPALTQASLPMISFFILTEVGLMQNVEMVRGVRTGIQSLFPSYQVLNYTVMCPFSPMFAVVNHRFRGRHQLFTCL